MAKTFKVVLLVESSRGSGRDFLRGIARYAHHHGPWSFYWEPGGFEIRQRTFETLDADGIIMRDVGRLKAQVLKMGLPSVVLGHRDREVKGLVNVVTDSKAIGTMAADHLLQCGFRHFAFCGLARSRLEQTPWSQMRLEAFQERIVEAGFSLPPAFVVPGPGSDWRKNRRQLADWLGALARPVGIMACNDDCGAQVAEACKLAGIEVPDEAGLVGVDNDEVICGLSDPAMTSVVLNFERAGYEAALALDKQMRKTGKAPATISVHATHIVTRRSTDVVAVEDEYVARALRFVRDQARNVFSVNEIARVAGISRRGLERRFRRELGGSILDEVRRHRSDQIARLLVETDLPVTRIAESQGFADLRHFARYFRTAKKITPRAFRKMYGRSG